MTLAKDKLPITVLVGTRNEALNIADCLRSVDRAVRRIVVDSNSTDQTAALAAAEGAEVVQFKLTPGGPKKRQWAMDHIEINTPWLLLLDADERIPGDLWTEIEQAIGASITPDAFTITKGFHFLGRKFRFGGFSHRAVLLLKPGRARFEVLMESRSDEPDMEIHERLHVDGEVASLATPLIHRDEKGLEAYKARHEDYAVWEGRLRAQYFRTGSFGSEGIEPNLFGNVQQRRRWLKLLSLRVPFEPLLWFMYHYFVRGAILEGRLGLLASWIRATHFANVRRKTRES